MDPKVSLAVPSKRDITHLDVLVGMYRLRWMFSAMIMVLSPLLRAMVSTFHVPGFQIFGSRRGALLLQDWLFDAIQSHTVILGRDVEHGACI